MKGNNLSKNKIMELANIFTSQVVSIYEFEKICGIPSSDILTVFNVDLYMIDERKAEQVNRILNTPKFLECEGYIKEAVQY